MEGIVWIVWIVSYKTLPPQPHSIHHVTLIPEQAALDDHQRLARLQCDVPSYTNDVCVRMFEISATL